MKHHPNLFKLPFKSYISSKPESPITILLHGFLGSHKNFTPLARTINTKLSHTTYTLDLRNHGRAPHGFPMDYSTMTNDLLEFCKQEKISDRKINIIGYSMGGKIALNLALNSSFSVNKLICIDNAPINHELSPEFQGYIYSMRQLDRWFQKRDYKNGEGLKKWKKDGLEWLKREANLPSTSFALYLLDNFHWDKNLGTASPKVPIYEFNKDVRKDLGSFPELQKDQVFKGDAMFIKATQGYRFITDEGVKIIKQRFNDPKIIELNDTHSGLMVNHYKENEKLCLEFLE